jgi:hypothetical protein
LQEQQAFGEVRELSSHHGELALGFALPSREIVDEFGARAAAFSPAMSFVNMGPARVVAFSSR